MNGKAPERSGPDGPNPEARANTDEQAWLTHPLNCVCAACIRWVDYLESE